MITVKTENYNLISQDFYNKTIDSLDLNLISCVCGHSGCLIRHGSYKCSIQLADRILSLSVVRVYCKICGHTHALLLSSMVPYSQIPLVLHVRLIHAYEHETGFRNILAEQYSTLRLSIHEPFRQRIVMNYNLEGMTKAEGHSYVAAKLNGAGCTQTVFEDNALEAILNAANGTPRMINKLCNASLLVGNSSNLNIITADAVMQAINDCELG